MPRKKLSEEIAMILKKQDVYGYQVDFGTHNIRYAVLAPSEPEARAKIDALHPGLPITYLYQSNRIIL